MRLIREPNVARELRKGRGAALLAAAIEGEAAERRSLSVRCGMAENRSKNACGKLRYGRSREGRHRLVAAKQGTCASVKGRGRRTSFGFGECAMVRPIATATSRQFLIAKSAKYIRAERSKAEHYNQQSCPDATH
jgi:hypothetical protein